MEASGQARWFERLLSELHFELWIGDAADIRTRRVRKQKTDRQDAQLILQLYGHPYVMESGHGGTPCRLAVWNRINNEDKRCIVQRISARRPRANHGISIFLGWRARLKGVHRSGLAGVAAMRHRTMDIGPASSTIDWLILSQGTVRSRDRPLLHIPISIVIMTISIAGLSFAQNAHPSNDPETTQASPSRDQTTSAESQAQINVNWFYGSYVPKNVPLVSLDARMRWKLYLRQTYTTPGIYIKTLLFATHDQVTDSNPEWGDDFQGFVKRLGNRQVQFIIQNSVSSLGNGIAGWEPRYDRCRCDGFWPRTRHAMVRNLLTYDRTETSLRPQLMPYLGAFVPHCLGTLTIERGSGDAFRSEY
jgi:hypothetical protein